MGYINFEIPCILLITIFMFPLLYIIEILTPDKSDGSVVMVIVAENGHGNMSSNPGRN